ncbi:MAG: FkbM family methyltransferase [Rhodospirillales bacterium]
MTGDRRLRMFQIGDGLEICLPDTLQEMATYVFLEQEAWFEDEVGFVRRYLEPGMRAVDIGAAYGAYALVMAKAVGPTGRLWCYEPVAATAAALRRSVERNAHGWVDVVEAAVADADGEAEIHVGGDVELSTLVPNRTFDARRREIVRTVDFGREAGRLEFGALDFVKLDAEGMEMAIVDAAPAVFAPEDGPGPLVMMEMYAGAATSNREPCERMKRLGMEAYRLLRGPNVLVPLEGEPLTSETLNAFFCMPARAQSLAERGLLVRHLPEVSAPPGTWLSLVRTARWFELQSDVIGGLGDFPRSNDERDYMAALDLFAVYTADRQGRPPAERVAALKRSFEALKTLCERAPRLERYLSLARIGREYSEVPQTQVALAAFIKALMESPDPITFSEPFLLPSRRIERLLDEGNIRPSERSMEALIEMAGSATIEVYELHRHLSSYFTANEIDSLLRIVQSLPYASAEIERRLLLKSARDIDDIAPSAFFAQSAEPPLNPDIWRPA